MKQKNYLTQQEVKEYLWRAFKTFMGGQTVMKDKKGESSYYRWDLENFLMNPERRFFD